MGIVEKCAQMRDEFIASGGCRKQPIHAVHNDLRDSIEPRCDRRDAHRHRFQQRHRQALETRGHQEKIDGVVKSRGVCDKAEETHICARAFAKGPLYRTGAGDHEDCVRMRAADLHGDSEEKREVLLVIEPPDSGDDRCIRRELQFPPQHRAPLGRGRESAKVDGVVDE